MKYSFDSKAGIILVKTKLHGPAGDGIVNLALDTGATWTLVSWEISVQRGYDPASVRERTPGNDGERGRILSEDKTETFRAISNFVEGNSWNLVFPCISTVSI